MNDQESTLDNIQSPNPLTLEQNTSLPHLLSTSTSLPPPVTPQLCGIQSGSDSEDEDEDFGNDALDSDCDLDDAFEGLEPDDPFLTAMDTLVEDFERNSQLAGMFLSGIYSSAVF